MSVAFDSNVTLNVSIGFASNPYATSYTYTDVSAYVLKIDIIRGRQQALSEIGTGKAVVVFDNDETLYEGFIQGYPQSFISSGNKAVTTVTCLDAFSLFHLARHTDNESEEASSVRVTNILNDIGWSSSKRDIATGVLDVQAETTDRDALTALRLTAASEGGEIFMAKDGDVKFNNRRTFLLNQTSQGTFGTGSGELPYADVTLNFDNTLLRNSWSITRTGGAEQTSTNTDSVTSYGSRVVKKTGQLQVSNADALSVASQFQVKYSEPGIRVEKMVFTPRVDTAIWSKALAAELLDRYTVKVPLPNGETLQSDVNIQRIVHKIDARKQTWEWSINTSPVTEIGYWLLGRVGNSELQVTTKLGF
jgi:hypothetical protein